MCVVQTLAWACVSIPVVAGGDLTARLPARHVTRRPHAGGTVLLATKLSDATPASADGITDVVATSTWQPRARGTVAAMLLALTTAALAVVGQHIAVVTYLDDFSDPAQEREPPPRTSRRRASRGSGGASPIVTGSVLETACYSLSLQCAALDGVNTRALPCDLARNLFARSCPPALWRAAEHCRARHVWRAPPLPHRAVRRPRRRVVPAPRPRVRAAQALGRRPARRRRQPPLPCAHPHAPPVLHRQLGV